MTIWKHLALVQQYAQAAQDFIRNDNSLTWEVLEKSAGSSADFPGSSADFPVAIIAEPWPLPPDYSASS